MPLGVEVESILPDVTVEMDCQLRDAEQRTLVTHQTLFGAIGSLDHDAAGKSQVAVEPRVQQHAAIDLHPQLACASGSRSIGLWLDAKIGAVGVCADQS